MERDERWVEMISSLSLKGELVTVQNFSKKGRGLVLAVGVRLGVEALRCEWPTSRASVSPVN
jgi:hypothetical protein